MMPNMIHLLTDSQRLSPVVVIVVVVVVVVALFRGSGVDVVDDRNPKNPKEESKRGHNPHP